MSDDIVPGLVPLQTGYRLQVTGYVHYVTCNLKRATSPLAIPRATLYNGPVMAKPQVDVTQLIQKDPAAWTAVLQRRFGDEGEKLPRVTAVASQRVFNNKAEPYSPHLLRYTLTLQGHSDPITCIGKRTNKAETLFYRDLAPNLSVAPPCWFYELGEEECWVILDDAPDDIPPARWSTEDALDLVQGLTRLHAAFWDDATLTRHHPWLAHFVGQKRPFTWKQLHEQQAQYFQEGPAAILSEHALHHAGRLAPLFLQAANGLAVMRSLGGWPGILGESHLAAAADLLDDPVLMLDRLSNLPATLLHGNVQNSHWRTSLLGSPRLLDWQDVSTGPGILDLVRFTEQFDVVYQPDLPWHITTRQASPASEETLIDSYILLMRTRLRQKFDARAFRQAIPAARCLHILLTWFPHFATWFAEMPNAYTWQKVNRLPDQELVGTRFETIIGYRTYLQDAFARFLQAYRTL